MNYYARFSNGQVRLYDWIAGLWLTIIVWIIGQVVLTSPFPIMLEEFDPETAAAANNAMNSGMTAETAVLTSIGVLLGLIGVVMAAIAYGVHYLGERGKASQVTGLVGAIMSFVGLVVISVGMGDMAEGSTLLLSVIGLSPVAYMLMLLTFPAALVGLYLAWKVIHKMPLTSLHTAWSRFRWRRAGEGFLIMWGVLGTYVVLMSVITGKSPDFIFDPARFWPFALVSLLLLPIQSATEEIVVRGYMNKGLIHWFGNKWVAFVLTSGAFMALHLSNPEALAGAADGNLPIVMSGYFFFGFAACLMVLIDDGLESAIGVHAGNNTFAAIFVNYENSVLPTPSVWQATPDPTSDSINVIVILSVVLGILYLTRTVRPQNSDLSTL